MALNKRQYVDGQTIVTASNLNEIQDCIITLENNYVPKTRTVAGKALSSNITLSAGDVGAVPTSRTINSKALTGNITLSAADVGAVPVSRTVNGKALSSNITLSAADVSAVPTTRTVNSKALSQDISLTASDVGAVPTGRTVNGKALSSNITLSAADVGAVPTSRKVNNKALSSDITLAATDIGYGSSNVGATLGSLNTAITSVENGLAIIVNGDTCSTAVPSDGYAYVKNNTHGLAEGLYRNKSSSAFPTSGGTANSTVFEAVSGGGLNDILPYKETAVPNTLLINATSSGTGRIFSYGKICMLRAPLFTVTETVASWSNVLKLPDGFATNTATQFILLFDTDNGAGKAAQARINGQYLQIFQAQGGSIYWGQGLFFNAL